MLAIVLYIDQRAQSLGIEALVGIVDTDDGDLLAVSGIHRRCAFRTKKWLRGINERIMVVVDKVVVAYQQKEENWDPVKHQKVMTVLGTIFSFTMTFLCVMYSVSAASAFRMVHCKKTEVSLRMYLGMSSNMRALDALYLPCDPINNLLGCDPDLLDRQTLEVTVLTESSNQVCFESFHLIPGVLAVFVIALHIVAFPLISLGVLLLWRHRQFSRDDSPRRSIVKLAPSALLKRWNSQLIRTKQSQWVRICLSLLHGIQEQAADTFLDRHVWWLESFFMRSDYRPSVFFMRHVDFFMMVTLSLLRQFIVPLNKLAAASSFIFLYCCCGVLFGYVLPYRRTVGWNTSVRLGSCIVGVLSSCCIIAAEYKSFAAAQIMSYCTVISCFLLFFLMTVAFIFAVFKQAETEGIEVRKRASQALSVVATSPSMLINPLGAHDVNRVRFTDHRPAENRASDFINPLRDNSVIRSNNVVSKFDTTALFDAYNAGNSHASYARNGNRSPSPAFGNPYGSRSSSPVPDVPYHNRSPSPLNAASDRW
jgi:hypothetical protein